MSDLCSSFFSMDSENLRYSYATLTEVTMWSALQGTISDSVSKIFKGQSQAGKTLQDKIENAVRQGRNMSDEEVRLRFLANLCETLEIPFPDLVSKQDCTDICNQITAKNIELYRSNHSDAVISNENDFVRAVAQDMFSTILKDLGRDDLDSDVFIGKTVEYLDALPQEQQEEIRRKLGVDEISQTALRNLIKKGSAGALFAIMVEAGGFSVYQGAVTALFSLSQIIGVTLPFGMYTGLTSAIAFFSSPPVLAGIIAYTGIRAYGKQDKSLRENLLPLIVALIMLQSIDSSDLSKTEINMKATIDRWQSYIENYSHLDDSIFQIKRQIAKERLILADSLSKSLEIQREIDTYNQQLETIIEDISALLESNHNLAAALTVTGPAQKEARAYLEAKRELNEAIMSYKRQSSSPRNSLFRSIIDTAYLANLKTKAKSRLKETARAIVSSLPCKVPPELSIYPEEVRKIKAEISNAQVRHKVAEEEVERSEEICNTLLTQMTTLENRKKAMGNHVPMLEEVYRRRKKGGMY